MSTVDRYAAGTPCFVELASPDVEASRAFYGELLGWSFEDDLATVHGDPVAGIVAGAVPAWWVHLAVDELGSTALDVPGRGRVLEVRDPTGASARLWQAGPFVGSVRVNEPGCPVWHELASPDLPVATRFWADLLDVEWRALPMETGDDYTCLFVDGRPVGGASVPSVAGVPPHWEVYFDVVDCDVTAARAEEMGAEVLVPPYDVPGVGRPALVRDPQGALVAFLQAPV